MTPADLAQHYSADELLAALCAKMNPANAVAAVRAIAPFLSEEDMAARARRLAAERSKRSYDKKTDKSSNSHGDQRQNPHGEHEEDPSDSHGEPSEKGGSSDGSVTSKEERFQTSKEETEEKEKPLRGKKKEIAADVSTLPCPPGLDTPDFRAEFKRWMKFRRGLGKKPRDWMVMFEEQLRWLAPFGETTAIAILGQSIRNGYQGLFELKPTNGNAGGYSLSAAAPSRARDPTSAEVSAWLDTCPRYASKRDEWTAYDKLPPFARDQFWQHQRIVKSPTTAITTTTDP